MAGNEGRMHIVYQTMAAAAVGMSALVASLSMGYTSPALPSMHKDPHFHITDEDGSWIGAVMPASALLGSLIAGPLLDNVGRRASLLHSTWPFMMSWAIIALSGSVGCVLLGRILGGACVGLQAVAGSVVIAETVHINLRNKLMIFPGLLGTLGILVSYAAGQFVSWRGLAWMSCLCCLPQIFLLLPLPETPFFLTRSGKKDLSVAALKQLRGTSQEAEKEQQELDDNYAENNKASSTIADLFQPPNLWPVVVGSALMLAQQTTGINAVIFYSSTIFEAAGDSLDPNTGSTVMGLVNFLSIFLSTYLAAICMRRYLIVLSTYLLLIALFVLSVFFWALESSPEVSSMAKSVPFVPVVALLTYIFGFSIGWGPVPWIFLGEGMPSSVRGLAAAIIVAINWGSAFIMTKTFQWSISLLGIHYTFLSYAVMTGISSTLIHQSMPETFGKSSAQMDSFYLQASKPKKE